MIPLFILFVKLHLVESLVGLAIIYAGSSLAVGSDNVDRRSWTHDSELSCTVIDGERDLREPTTDGEPGGYEGEMGGQRKDIVSVSK